MEKSKQLNVAVPASVLRQVKEQCRARGTLLYAATTEALKLWLKSKESK